LSRTQVEAGFLQGEEALGVEAIDTDGFTVDTQFFKEFDDLGSDRCGARPASRADVEHRPASRFLHFHGGMRCRIDRYESVLPQGGFALSWHQDVPIHRVQRPHGHHGSAGDVSDVVGVE